MAGHLRRALALAPKLASSFSSSASRAKKPLKSTRQVGKNPSDVPEYGPPRPAEIPFQSKVANSVTLIGRVDVPVQFEAAPDGKFWAATVISRNAAGGGTVSSSSNGPSLSIPILFEGDLAHVAAFHLKEKDHVCIEGQLIADPPPSINASQALTDVQVMVHTINFVEGYSPRAVPQFVRSLDIFRRRFSYPVLGAYGEAYTLWFSHAECIDDDKNVPISDLAGRWLDPEDWQESDRAVASQPKGVISPDEFSEVPDARKPIGTSKATFEKSVANKDDEHWKNLLDNPTHWKDYRDKKERNLVKPRYPDFKSKDGSVSLWISSAPKWVLSKMDTLKFDNSTPEPKSVKKPSTGEDAWKSLVENPNKWWDNRSKKVKVTSPDFRHKETGEALWLDSSPSWVSSRLPPTRPA